jgi:hypothetical protein
MPINIDQLKESELIDLNYRIVARLRFLRQLGAYATLTLLPNVNHILESATSDDRRANIAPPL